MNSRLLLRLWIFLLLVLTACSRPALGQAGLGDDRVMLQGFYWESYRHGHAEKFPTFGDKQWYDIVKEQADTIHAARFDLIWLPPPSFAGQYSAGYGPKEYFKLDNSYGTFQQHRAMLESLLNDGIEPVADLVLNHRDGESDWADFKNPDWDTRTICSSDEFFKPGNPGAGVPADQRGAEEEMPKEYASGRSTTYQYGSFRDLDHTNPQVHHDIVRYMLQLKSAGYRGWRYDMVHGYHARWIAYYNKHTQPTFSVGEYDWSAHNEQRGWIWWTATQKDHFDTSSSVFDFTTFFTLKANKGQYFAWYGFGNGIGMVGDNTDNVDWKNRSMTFVENHDTGYRTGEDGTFEKDHQFDSFANTWEVEQAYAQILTHPGVPCVYWKHYFDWGQDLQNKIRALINARKVAGVNASSAVHLQENARAKGVYAANVEGTHGSLYVRIGGNDNDWQPAFSGYQNFREYAQGAGWKVWIGLPGNPDFQQAPLTSAFPIPQYTPAENIPPPTDP